MDEIECYAKSRGFKRLCLTTHDKQHFYAHIGYVLSTPVQNAGAMTAFVPMEMLLRFSRMPADEASQQKQTQTKTDTHVPQKNRDLEGVSVPPLPPSPPPPPAALSIPSPPLAPPLTVPPPLPPPFIAPPCPTMPPPLSLSPRSEGQAILQTLTETPYKDAKGVPIFWMHKDI
ncbi:uncharacterized protein V6R79_000593 [Siganus canaliculatus]